MRKILIYLMLLFVLVGCHKVIIRNYDVKQLNSFISEIMEYEVGNKTGVLFLDLRSLGTEEGREEGTFSGNHIKGFTSYDISKGNQAEMTTWLKGMYHMSTTIFIIDEDGSDVEKVSNWIKEAGYKEIHLYHSGFKSIEENAHDLLQFVSGLEDCGC